MKHLRVIITHIMIKAISIMEQITSLRNGGPFYLLLCFPLSSFSTIVLLLPFLGFVNRVLWFPCPLHPHLLFSYTFPAYLRLHLREQWRWSFKCNTFSVEIFMIRIVNRSNHFNHSSSKWFSGERVTCLILSPSHVLLAYLRLHFKERWWRY